MIDHPDIRRAIRTGYPEPERKYYGHDFFGLTVLEGEEIMELDDEFFLKQPLPYEAIAILRYVGAITKIAE